MNEMSMKQWRKDAEEEKGKKSAEEPEQFFSASTPVFLSLSVYQYNPSNSVVIQNSLFVVHSKRMQPTAQAWYM